MAESLILNGNSSVAKGTVIYEKGEPVQTVALLLKGRVTIQGEGIRMVAGSGNFLGMCDVWQKKHSFTYVALDDLVLYGLPVETPEQVGVLLDEKPQYRGLLVTSLNFFFHDIFRVYNKIKKEAEKVYEFVNTAYQQYARLAEKAGLAADQLTALERLNEKQMEEYALPEKLLYYVQCSKISVEIQKNYYGANAYVARTQFAGQCEVLPRLLEGCRYYSDWLARVFRIMITDEKNLFSLVGRMALGVKRAGQNDRELAGMLDEILNQINATETVLLESAGIDLNLDRQRMEETYFALLSDDTGSLDAFDQQDLKVLDHSVQQILDYAPVRGRVAEGFAQSMAAFTGLDDPFARTPEATAVRKKLAADFFELYEAVVKKSFDDPRPPLAVKLFLRYGYVSEELLTEEELRVLLTLPDSRDEQMNCRVYTMAEWLREIYEGRKNPSKDEFDMDYEDHIRKEIQEGKRDKKDFDQAFGDRDGRLHFEVQNVLRYADRILSGNISIFVPVLCSGVIFTKLENAVVTAAEINKTVNRIEKIDYSIFHRERLTAYEDVEITHFSVTERYTPEFILFPVYGRSGLMWQDIEGRRKQTHGRILLPSFVEQNLEGEIMKMLAYFRWEKCRTEMGAQWNNYRYPSLTAEYTDYLQFYKKNSDLSPEWREKVKAQLQQCNSRHKEVFVRDYTDWILREAAGARKLNRVAREILFTYCPLSPQIAEGLVSQNAYADAARRYMTEKGKREKMINTAIHRFEKAGLEVPPEVEQTKRLVLHIQGV